MKNKYFEAILNDFRSTYKKVLNYAITEINKKGEYGKAL